MSGRFLWIATMVVAAGLAEHTARAEDTIVTTYYVAGNSTQRPNEDRPWSTYFDTRRAAEDRLREIQRDYASGGLLASSPDKPINLRVVEEKRIVPRSRAPRPEDQGSYIPAPRRPAPAPEMTKVAGTRWIGEEAGSAVTFAFHANGTAYAYDQFGTWRGTWRQDGRNVTIQLTQPNAVNYSGQIRGNRLSGTARNVGTGRTWSWAVSLD